MEPSDNTTRRATPPSADPQDGGFAPGTILADRYRIVALLGRGGMGDVYRADDLRLGQQVALKFLPARYESDPLAHGLLVAEARNARAIAHPNVCRVYDVGDLGGRPFLTMEYVDGEDLASLLRRIGRLPAAKAQEVARHVVAGLASAHERGVLHRDLKPSNVMIDGRGRARIMDFGLAVEPGRDGSPADFAGTLAYMAPERMHGAPATMQSDLYAVGLLLYEVCTGSAAFSASTIDEWRRVHDEFVPRPPSELSGDIDPALERAIVWCLEKAPGNRPPSAARLFASLPGGDPLTAAIAAGDTPSPELVAASGGEGTLTRRRAWLSVAACLASVVGGVALWSWILLANAVTFEGSPDVLRAQAVRVLRDCGLSVRGGEGAWWFFEDPAERQHLTRDGTANSRFVRSQVMSPGPLSFRFRWTPVALAPLHVDGLVSTTDPAPDVPGDATVHLDPAGRLTFLRVVPAVRSAATPGTGAREPSWLPLFAAAGLEPGAFRPATPEWLPGVPYESRTAWTGQAAGEPLRVEAAAVAGRPVFFRLVRPWTWQTFQPAEPSPRSVTGIVSHALAVGWIVTIGVLAVLARRNLRLGRGDRRGAFRTALVVLAVLAVSDVIRRQWTLDSAWVWGMVSRQQGHALFMAAAVWLYYVGFEPFARRRWPQMLIAWTRLLAGRWRDPLVGQSILAGTVLGGVLVALGALPEVIGRVFDLPRVVPHFAGDSLNPLGRYAASLAGALIDGITMSFGLVALRLVVRMVVANERVVWGMVIATAAAASMSGAEPVAADVAQALAIGVLVALTLRNLGLLALVVTVTVNYLLRFTPWTFDPSAWFVWRPVLTAGLMAAVVAWGFLNVLGRESALQKPT